MPLLGIKYSKTLIENKPFFDQLVKKKKKKAFEKIIKISKNKNYITGDLLGYLYHQTYYRLIHRDLSRETNKSIPKQIKFVEKLEEDDAVKMFFITENQ